MPEPPETTRFSADTVRGGPSSVRSAAKPLPKWRRKLVFWLLPEGYSLMRRETIEEMQARVNAPFAEYDKTVAELDAEEFEGGYPWPNL